ncbi:alanine racemase, partial [Clostridium perfringens]
MNLLDPIWAEINLNNFIYNIEQRKNKSHGSEIIGVVKANAYGHGAVEISKVLINNGIKRLAVANIVEAIELRENDIKSPIMLLGISENYAIDALLEYDVEPTVSSYEFAINLNNKARALNKIIPIH